MEKFNPEKEKVYLKNLHKEGIVRNAIKRRLDSTNKPQEKYHEKHDTNLGDKEWIV